MCVQVRLFAFSTILLLAITVPGRCVSVLPGWPQITGDQVWSSPVLGDLSGDGQLDVVVGSNDGKVYAWQANGVPLPAWPQATGGRVNSSPALVDLDSDGHVAVVVGSNDGKVYAWHANGTSVAGWPAVMDGGTGGPPSVGDLDGDGELEVVCGAGHGKVYAWHANGTPVAGWPRSVGATATDVDTAVGDLDGDGRCEVVGVTVVGSNVYAWRGNGGLMAGWPQSIGGSGEGSYAALGDLNGDGRLEIVAGTGDGYVRAWNADGTSLPGWPQSTGGTYWNSPVLGDLDGDGQLEVVAEACYTDREEVYAWRADGSLVAGWPQTAGLLGFVKGSPSLGDLDGDGRLEILIGAKDGTVQAWHDNGASATGWPLVAPDGVGSSPALGDLDGDGKLEVVAGCWDQQVYVWKCDTFTSDLLPWPMFRHDPQRAALYQPPAPVVGFSGTPTIGFAPLNVQFTDLSIYSPSAWNWTFGDGGASTTRDPSHSFAKVGTYPVSLTVSNAAGTDSISREHYVVVTFPDVPFEPVEYWSLRQILACVDAGVVKGYNDGTYAPTQAVTRDQMAVYIARSVALPTGDAAVPDGPATATFVDVPNTGYGTDGTEPYWAYKYIEYCVSHGVVKGYDPIHYGPTGVVTRDQMAVFVARAKGWVSITDALDTAPQIFPDVPAGFWCGVAIEDCVSHNVVHGYNNGNYAPGDPVTRDQMAVYIQRAFQLSM